MTTPNTTQAAPAVPATHEEHASLLHTIFADLEKVAKGITNPALLAFLPAKYQAYALAIGAVEQTVESISAPAASAQ